MPPPSRPHYAGGTASGFYEGVEAHSEARLYVLVDKGSLRAFNVPCIAASLDRTLAFVLHKDDTYFLWCGAASPCMVLRRGCC